MFSCQAIYCRGVQLKVLATECFLLVLNELRMEIRFRNLKSNLTVCDLIIKSYVAFKNSLS